MMQGKPIATDWTDGAGVFPSNGVISVAAEPNRRSILVVNKDTTAIALEVTALESDMVTPATVTIGLDPAAATGEAGGFLNLGGLGGFMTNAAFTVTGTAGSQVCVLTN